MKKIFTVVMAVAFAFSVAGFAVAAEKAAAPAAEKSAVSAEKSAVSAEKSAVSAEKSATAAKKPAKPKAQQVTGTVEAVDAAAGTFTVKGKKGNVDLKAGEKVNLGDVKVGDKVVVKYADGTASSVKAVKAAKAAKKAEAKPMVEKAPPKVDTSPAAEKPGTPSTSTPPKPKGN
jgi:uncharacterized lipoprotein NlpE involved in copper resistance